MEWWIDMFKCLVDGGIYNSEIEYHCHAARYVFGPLLKQQLSEFKEMWYQHRMRRNRFAACPCDVPDDLYNLFGSMSRKALQLSFSL